MALLIKFSGETREVLPKNGHYFKLEEYYELLDCHLIEIITLSDGRVMVLDEESKLREDWEINLDATELYRQGRMSENAYREYLKKLADQSNMTFIDAREDTLDCIAGDVLVGTGQEIQ